MSIKKRTIILQLRLRRTADHNRIQFRLQALAEEIAAHELGIQSLIHKGIRDQRGDDCVDPRGNLEGMCEVRIGWIAS